MIYQISPVKTKTESLSHLSKGLIQARHIQSRIKADTGHLPKAGLFWSPMSGGPELVPVMQWFD